MASALFNLPGNYYDTEGLEKCFEKRFTSYVVLRVLHGILYSSTR